MNPHEEQGIKFSACLRLTFVGSLENLVTTWRSCWRGCIIFVPDRRDGLWRIRCWSPVVCARHSEQRDPRTRTETHALRRRVFLRQTQELPDKFDARNS